MHARLIAVFAFISVIATACGGGSNDTATPVTTTTTMETTTSKIGRAHV